MLTCALLTLPLVTAGLLPRALPSDFVAKPVTDGPVTAQLMPDTTRWIPGRDHLVGVKFTTDPGWHLYWPGQNDSGFPIQIEPTAEKKKVPANERLTTGALRWPVPERLVYGEGAFVDHVYHDTVTLLIPVHVPYNAEPGSLLTLKLETDWFVCEEACLMGSAQIALSMPVAEPSEALARSKDADHLGGVLQRIPFGMAQDVSVEILGDHGNILQVTVPRATRIAFYPAEESLALTGIADSCTAPGPRLRLQTDPTPPYRPESAARPRLRGILEVWYGDGNPSRLSSIDLPGPDPADLQRIPGNTGNER
ncbi:MAG: protein-disulfide reductase DsbD family protein [Planctomycetota bacterium]|nr:protein-disulfide reductase DsbD family protein [Planctomycetota bacterium]